MLLKPCLLLLVLGLVVGTISMTLTKAFIFKGLRDKLKVTWMKELFNCPYCTGHWVALPFIGLLAKHLPQWTDARLMDGVINFFSVVALSAFVDGLIYLAIHQMSNQEAREEKIKQEAIKATLEWVEEQKKSAGS